MRPTRVRTPRFLKCTFALALALSASTLTGGRAAACDLVPVDPMSSSQNYDHQDHSGHDHSLATLMNTVATNICLNGGLLVRASLTLRDFSGSDLTGVDLTSASWGGSG